MGFKYVLVPASPNEEIQELEFEHDVVDLAQDKFRERVENYFRTLSLDQSVDKSMLVEQLQQRTGMDLSKHQGKDLDNLLNSTSVEIFPVLLPMKENDFMSISVYCDDKGVAKNLEENARMTGLIQACGYPQQSFRGDVFIGRVFDDTEDEWRRMDFSLKDMSADADWVMMSRKQREKKSSGDVAALANMVGAKNPANINPSMLQDAVPKGETEQYAWRQADEEVEITFKKDGLQKGDKKAVKVTFGRNKLKVEAKGDVLIDAELFASTTPDESTWTLSDGVLQVTLTKAESATWSSLLKA